MIGTIDLKDNLSNILSINLTRQRALSNLGILSVQDLIFRFPIKYENTSLISNFINFINSPENIATIYVTFRSGSNLYVKSNLTIQNFEFLDKSDSTKINVKSFNRQFLINSLIIGNEYYIKVKKHINRYGKTEIYLLDIEKVNLNKGQLHVGTISPVYRLSKGISIKYYRRILYTVFEKLFKANVSLNTYLNNYLNLSLEDLSYIHFPKDLEQVNSKIQKLSLYEIATIYLKLKYPKIKSINNKINYNMTTDFTPQMFAKIINMKLSEDQEKIMQILYMKYKSNDSFDILIQGDVGSGKSLVAFYALILNYFTNTKSLLLAPTSVLVDQHFDNLFKICSKLNIKLYKFHKNNKLEVDETDHSIIVGTTALNYKAFCNIGLVIFDEQQKFGVFQKEKSFLKEISKKPNFIEMTATPIPRTILRYLFDDLEIYYLKTMPFGDRKVQTFLIRKSKSQEFYEKLIKKILCGEIKKCLVVVPASESENFVNVDKFSKKIRVITADLMIKSITGKMKEIEKLSVLNSFKNGEIHLLVATSVVEIGINIPDLDVILIVSPQMFGLSQLHQMRGRVGRTGKEGMCFLIEEEDLNDLQLEKIIFFTKNNDGMLLAEKDFSMRGPGDLLGDRQIGMPNFKVASFADINALKQGVELGKKILEEGKIIDFLNKNPFYEY